MKTKRIIAAALAVCMALTVVSCGNSESGSAKVKDPDNITEEDFEKAAEKLDSMSEEDFEKALDGKGGIDLGGDTDTGKAAEEEPAEAKPEYEPCDEIKNADFTSGLIQIGNDVFKCGGYLTLREFVEKYGENWDCSGIDLNAEIPTEKPVDDHHTYPDVFCFDIANKEDSTKAIKVSYFVIYNSIELNKNVLEKYTSKNEYLDTEKANSFAPYAYFEGFRKKNTLKLYEIPDDIYNFYEYPEGSTLGDTIVYDVRPTDTAIQITFYPKGMPWTNDGNENFVLDFYKSNSNAESILNKESFKELMGDTSKAETMVIYPERSSTLISALYTNSMVDKQIIQWGYTDPEISLSTVFSYNIKLKDKNLLGFEPTLCLTVNSDESYKTHSIKYREYQIIDDAIVFTDGQW